MPKSGPLADFPGQYYIICSTLKKNKTLLSVEVNSFPIAEVIGDTCDAFGIGSTEGYGKCYIDIPEHLGKGNIRGIGSNGGTGMVQYD